MTTPKEFKADRQAVRWISDNHPSETVKHHAKRLWDAMEPAVKDPDNAPSHTKRAITKCKNMLAEVIAKYRARRK